MNNQQAINLLKNLEQSLDDYCELNDEGKTAFRMAITALELFGNSEQLPSAQRWIPVSEKLPEEDTEVLISYRYKEGEGDTSNTYIDITTYGQMYFGGNKVGDYKHWRAPFEYFESNYEVIAWKPLPEPYRGGGK